MKGTGRPSSGVRSWWASTAWPTVPPLPRRVTAAPARRQVPEKCQSPGWRTWNDNYKSHTCPLSRRVWAQASPFEDPPLRTGQRHLIIQEWDAASWEPAQQKGAGNPRWHFFGKLTSVAGWPRPKRMGFSTFFPNCSSEGRSDTEWVSVWLKVMHGTYRCWLQQLDSQKSFSLQGQESKA